MRDADRGQQASRRTGRRRAAARRRRRAPGGRRARAARRSMPWVRATKSGARPIGSMTTKSVTKARDQQLEHQRRPRRLEPLERGEPQRLGAGEPVLHLGALPLQRLDLARCRRGRRAAGWPAAASIAVAHLLELRHPRLALRHLGPERRRGAARRGRAAASRGFSSRARAGAPPRSDSSMPAVGLHVVVERPHRAVLDQPQPVGDQLDQVRVVADEDHRAAVLGQRLDQRLAALDVEVVGRLVEDDQVRRVERGEQQAQPRLLPARQPPDLGRRDVGAEPAGREPRRAASPGGSSGPQPRAGAAAASRRRAARRPGAGRSSRPAASTRRPCAPPSAPAGRTSSFASVDLPWPFCAEQRDPVVLVDAQVEVAAAPAAVVADADVLEPDDRRRQRLGRRGS